MKFTTLTLLIASLASTVIANPINPEAAAVNPEVAAVNDSSKTSVCKFCDDYYNDCRKSSWCWVPGANCDYSCNVDTCKWNSFCKKCGYDKC